MSRWLIRLGWAITAVLLIVVFTVLASAPIFTARNLWTTYLLPILFGLAGVAVIGWLGRRQN
jgi:hypothetical protein